MRLEAKKIEKKYFRKSGEANWFYAVKPVEFTLQPGKLTVLTGRSGSGKTTLLQMLAGLLMPSAGEIMADGQSLYAMKDGALSRFRNAHIAVIPQGNSAVSSLTVLENVLLPVQLYGKAGNDCEARKRLELFSIGHLVDAYPAELSGGELRRMVIVRAMSQNAEILLADEPTGDLDDENSLLVFHALQEQARSGKSVLLVTHEETSLEFADVHWKMMAGELYRSK